LEEQKQLEKDELELEMIDNELDHFRETVLPYAKKEHAELKKAFETFWKLRRRVDNQVRNHIDHSIFQRYNMRTQAYHGGDKYTGVDIGFFMGKTEDITEEIKTYLQELKHPVKEATDRQISDICDLIKRFLRLLDILLSILRKNNSEVTNDDIVTYEQTADQAALLWQKLDLHCTPSFHFVHREDPLPRTMVAGNPRATTTWRADGRLWSRATKIWTIFNDDSAALALMRNEQWQSIDWKRWQRIQIQIRI
jgi:hypothetical protein